MNRRINSELIRKWISANGENARLKLALEARVSTSVIEKLAAGLYPCLPKQFTRERICAAMGVTENQLFPFTDGKKKAS